MLICREISTFDEYLDNAWSGAIQTLEAIREKGYENEAIELIEQTFEGGDVPTETEVNDYIWFDLEDNLKEYYGIDLWER